MTNLTDLTATVIALLTATNGANLAEEHESAAHASQHLHDAADCMTEYADLHLHNRNIEVAHFVNGDDICCFAVTVMTHNFDVFENKQGGDVIACFAYADQSDAVAAAAAVMSAIVNSY